MRDRIERYFATLGGLALQTRATSGDGDILALDAAMAQATAMATTACARGGRLIFVGNGGSAGIASHMTIDYGKNGNLRALCFNDGAALTCLGNDLGYEQVFARQVDMHGRSDDLLIAISSSGCSPNILNAAHAARAKAAAVLTLSGFRDDNPLRRLGDVNFHVPSMEYGFVEITHLSLLHAILDLHMGWPG